MVLGIEALVKDAKIFILQLTLMVATRLGTLPQSGHFSSTSRRCTVMIYSSSKALFSGWTGCHRRALIILCCLHPLCSTCSTSPTGSRNHLASFRFQNTFRLNVWNRNGNRWFSDPVGEVLEFKLSLQYTLNSIRGCLKIQINSTIG